MTTEKRAGDELVSESGRQLLRLLAAASLAGGAVRLGVAAVRNAGPRYEAPKIPDPMIVDMPYTPRTVPSPPVAAIPLPGKERPAAKAAAGPLDWLPDGVPGKQTLLDLIPTYTPPTGPAGATDPKQVPLFGAAEVLTGVGGLGAGYLLTDRLARAADRNGATEDLENAKREYQAAVLGRLARTDLATKRAADAAVPPELKGLRAAIDRLYDAVATKRADGPDSPGQAAARTAVGALFPGTLLGPDAARINMAVAALAGLGGGYVGYDAARDGSAAKQVRKSVRRVEEANATAVPRPVVARLVPVGGPT